MALGPDLKFNLGVIFTLKRKNDEMKGIKYLEEPNTIQALNG